MADGFRKFVDLFSARSGSEKAAQYGRFPVPGELVIELPGGTTRLYYDESVGSSGDDAASFDAPDDLQIELVEVATGDAVAIRRKSQSQVSNSVSKDFSRAYLGRAEVPSAGSYRVSVTTANTSTNDPHVSLG